MKVQKKCIKVYLTFYFTYTGNGSGETGKRPLLDHRRKIGIYVRRRRKFTAATTRLSTKTPNEIVPRTKWFLSEWQRIWWHTASGLYSYRAFKFSVPMFPIAFQELANCYGPQTYPFDYGAPATSYGESWPSYENIAQYSKMAHGSPMHEGSPPPLQNPGGTLEYGSYHYNPSPYQLDSGKWEQIICCIHNIACLTSLLIV